MPGELSWVTHHPCTLVRSHLLAGFVLSPEGLSSEVVDECRGITKAGVQTEMIDALSADPQVCACAFHASRSLLQALSHGCFIHVSVEHTVSCPVFLSPSCLPRTHSRFQCFKSLGSWREQHKVVDPYCQVCAESDCCTCRR